MELFQMEKETIIVTLFDYEILFQLSMATEQEGGGKGEWWDDDELCIITGEYTTV